MDKNKMITRAIAKGQNPERAIEMLNRIFAENTKNKYNLVYELRYWGFISGYQAEKMLGI